MGTQNHYRSGSLNLNVRGLKQSATLAINEQSNALRRAGRRIYKLGLGRSSFPVPSEVVNALKHHAHERDYLPPSPPPSPTRGEGAKKVGATPCGCPAPWLSGPVVASP